MKLTRKNYHSIKANKAYLSRSQIEDFMSCEALWKAKYQDRTWTQHSTAAMLVGSYVDIALLDPKGLDAFCEANNVLKKDGNLRSEFLMANRMVEAALKQKFAGTYLDGDRHAILTFELFGHPIKAELDVLNLEEKRFVDVKTCPAVWEEKWMNGPLLYGKLPFYARYWRQMGLYMEGVRQVHGFVPDCYIYAISKETPPDVDLLFMADISYMSQLVQELKPVLDRLSLVKSGEEEPRRCELCGVCRLTRTITKAVSVYGPEEE